MSLIRLPRKSERRYSDAIVSAFALPATFALFHQFAQLSQNATQSRSSSHLSTQLFRSFGLAPGDSLASQPLASVEMADNQYPDDIQFAGLVQAATAAAVERHSPQTVTGKRKREGAAESEQQDEAVGAPSRLVNSAAVLFREPSEKSKKYSRPPLGKVYTSLELAPENFLKLQVAAKDFMLDEEHEGRRDVVGHKKNSGNADTSRLKLWKCVEEFLSQGNGEKYFGPEAGAGIPDTPPRTFFWPHDTQKIIKLCMPLFRKMVTNERQRLYAAETRKTGLKKDAEDGDTAFPGSMMEEETSMNNVDIAAAASAASNSSTQIHEARQAENGTSVALGHGLQRIFVNVMAPLSSGLSQRIIPRFSLHPDSTTLSVLRDEVGQRLNSNQDDQSFAHLDMKDASVRVWMPDGLVKVHDDGEWTISLLHAGTHQWMDGEVRVLVEF